MSFVFFPYPILLKLRVAALRFQYNEKFRAVFHGNVNNKTYLKTSSSLGFCYSKANKSLANRIWEKISSMKLGLHQKFCKNSMKGLGWKNAWKRSIHTDSRSETLLLSLSTLAAVVLFWLFAFDRVPDARSKVEQRKAEGKEAFSCIQSRKAMAEKPSWKRSWS